MMPLNWRQVNEYLRGAAKASDWEECGFVAVPSEYKGPISRMWAAWHIYPIRNQHERPQHNYLMSNPDQIEAFEDMTNKELRIWGAYHTHPSGNVEPSPQDQHEWHYPTELKMIIATTQDVAVWSWDGDKFSREV